MRIVIVHMHFNTPLSGGPLRSYYLAQGFLKEGAECEVITTHNISQYEKKEIDGIKVHFLPVSYSNYFGFYKRIRAFLQFNQQATRFIKKLQKPDLLYCISTPLTTGIIGMRMKATINCPFIFEVGDLWPEAPVQMGVIKNTLIKKQLYHLESGIYREAKGIVALSPPIKKYIARQVPEKKICVVTNMSDLEFFHPAQQDTQKDKETQTKYVISSIGAVGKANQLEFLVEAARFFNTKDNRIHFNVMGDGSERARLMKLAEGLENISFLPFGNKEQVRQTLSESNAIYISYKSIPVLETGSPNKLFDGLAAGKLIITNFGGWIAETIEAHSCGFRTDPENPEDFWQKLQPFMSPGQQALVEKNALQLAAEYALERQQKKLMKFLFKETL
ncbi:MAG: glycosyltransferase family 4 protein [Cyclobacteriaceae bacterium]|nr:glycosyltransferase family 4 protein [Cyclobacteriaceae bacterium]